MPTSQEQVNRRLIGAPFAPQQVFALQRSLDPSFSNFTTATITLGAATLDAAAVRPELGITLAGARTYAIEMQLFGVFAVTAGIQFDFAGGTVVADLFVGRSISRVAGAQVVITNAVTAALNTPISNIVASDHFKFEGVIRTSAAGGLLIPRINRAGAGTTTVAPGSFILARPID